MVIKQQANTPNGTVLRAHLIELRPTVPRARYLAKCAGTMRFVYNSLVAKWKAGDKYDRKTYQKHCSTLRQTTTWMTEVSCRATYEAADNFHTAASNFFKSCKGERIGKKSKPPKFKKKGRTRNIVKFSHRTQFSIKGRKLKISGLKEEILTREKVRFKGRIQSLSMSKRAGKWYASFLVRVEETPPDKTPSTQKPSVGVDFGIKVLATLSNGEAIPNPKPLRKKLRLLKRRQRQVSKKYVKGQAQSNRYKIAAARVARLHKKVVDQRSAAQHRLTTGLVQRFGRIVIEDLNVTGMLKNRNLASSIADAGWGTLRWQLAYKSKAAGAELVVADRWFASSKTCSCCGYKLEKLTLATRTFVCPSCGFSSDRDVNAAINLEAYVPKQVATDYGETFKKPRILDLCKTEPQGEAGLPDGANIKPKHKLRISTEAHS